MKAESFSDMLVGLYPWIKGQAYRICGNKCDAEDLASEVIYKMLKNSERFDCSRDLKPWATSIIFNTYITNFNRRKCVQFVEVDNDACFYSYHDSQSNISVKRIFSIIRKCARQSCTIECVLLYAKGYTYEEISQLLHIPIGTVRSRISLGRKTLKRALEY